MMSAVEAVRAAVPESTIEKVAGLLGGSRVLGRKLTSDLQAHELLAEGLPGSALGYLVSHALILGKPENLEQALGISLRTLQRRKEEPKKRLTPEQSSRTWKFAEILLKTTNLLGSQAAAEEWLVRPALALGRRRPLELLSTPAGTRALETYLGQIEYGVYV